MNLPQRHIHESSRTKSKMNRSNSSIQLAVSVGVSSPSHLNLHLIMPIVKLGDGPRRRIRGAVVESRRAHERGILSASSRWFRNGRHTRIRSAMNRHVQPYEDEEARNRREIENVGVRKVAFQAMILDLITRLRRFKYCFSFYVSAVP